MKTAFLFGMLIHAFAAFAATGPAILGASGASGFVGSGTPTIFGGLAGTSCSGAAADQFTACNSCQTSFMDSTCTTSPLCPCNTVRIYDGLILTINLSNSTTDANGATTTTPGNAIVQASSGANSSVTASSSPVPLQNASNGGTSVSMNWTTLCSFVSGSNCEAITNNVSTVNLTIYLDANNSGAVDSGDPSTQVTVRFIKPPVDYATYGTSGNKQGIGSFTPYPGDGKIYIHEPQTTTDFPTLGYTSVIKAIRVFASDNNLPKANPVESTMTTDLPVSDDGSSLSKNIVTGLTNDTRYYFRLGMLDEANNVVMLSPDPAVDSDAASTECSSPSGADNGACKYSAKPSEVAGILPNDLNCFVATAAYGTMLEPKLRTFREFRNRVLQSTRFGRSMTLLYYEYGPYAARFIADKPAWRTATRVALWPAFGLSWLSLRFGLANVVLATVMLFGVALAWRGRKGARA